MMNEEAIQLAGEFLRVAGEGTAEVREVIDSPVPAVAGALGIGAVAVRA